MIVDFRRTGRRGHPPLHINGEAVECVNELRFLGVTLSYKLTWTSWLKKPNRDCFFKGS